MDPFLAKMEELVDRRRGRSARTWRTTRWWRWATPGRSAPPGGRSPRLKAAWRAGRRRVHRPWVPEPGMWLQYDFGDGPVIGHGETTLFCVAGVVAVPGGDPAAGQDACRQRGRCGRHALRAFGGVPTYLLTDNEKTVTVEHVAGMPVRNPAVVGSAGTTG